MKRPFHVGSVMLGLLAMIACSNEPARTADDQPYTGTESSTAAVDPSLTPASAEPAPVANAREGELVAPTEKSPGDTRRVADNKAATAGTARNDAAPAAPANPPTAAAPTSPGVAPDNTKVNKRDANSAALTPVDQGNGEVDLRITQQIRQAVMADNSLSFTAKNVKIITLNGSVTLRGPVNTAAERSAIDAAARKVAGAQVDNQIEVKK